MWEVSNFISIGYEANTVKNITSMLLAIFIPERKTLCPLSMTTADSTIIGFLFTGLTAFYFRRGGGEQTDRGQYVNPTCSDQSWENIGCRSTY
jgi:hypothetical protein